MPIRLLAKRPDCQIQTAPPIHARRRKALRKAQSHEKGTVQPSQKRRAAHALHRDSSGFRAFNASSLQFSQAPPDEPDTGKVGGRGAEIQLAVFDSGGGVLLAIDDVRQAEVSGREVGGG